MGDVTALLSVLFLAAPVPPACPNGQPYVVVAGTSGLGPGTVHGIVAAIWPDGRVLRAQDPSDTSQGCITGHAPGTEVVALTTLLQRLRIYELQRSFRGIDLPEAWLAVCTGGQRSTWKHIAGATDALVQIQRFLVAIEISDARAIEEPRIQEWIQWFRDGAPAKRGASTRGDAAQQLDAADEARASSAGWRGPRS
jgi:hypothetical protein